MKVLVIEKTVPGIQRRETPGDVEGWCVCLFRSDTPAGRWQLQLNDDAIPILRNKSEAMHVAQEFIRLHSRRSAIVEYKWTHQSQEVVS